MEEIGRGGEAVVYRDGDQAIKIFETSYSRRVAESLVNYSYNAIVTPTQIIYKDSVYQGYSMPYIESTKDIHEINKEELLNSYMVLREDMINLAFDGFIARDLIPENSILYSHQIYLIDTSLYDFSDYRTRDADIINLTHLNTYLKNLFYESTRSRASIDYLKSLKLDIYQQIYNNMTDTETLEDFAKRLAKQK